MPLDLPASGNLMLDVSVDGGRLGNLGVACVVVHICSSVTSREYIDAGIEPDMRIL